MIFNKKLMKFIEKCSVLGNKALSKDHKTLVKTFHSNRKQKTSEEAAEFSITASIQVI